MMETQGNREFPIRPIVHRRTACPRVKTGTRDAVARDRRNSPGMKRHPTAALARARAAQIHIISRKLETKDATTADWIADAVAGSSPGGGLRAARRVSFACNSARTSLGIAT